MNDELDRIIKELGILRINIASMAARVESLQQSLEQLKTYPVEDSEPEPQDRHTETSADEVMMELENEREAESVHTEVCEPESDADAIAESAETEEADDAIDVPESHEETIGAIEPPAHTVIPESDHVSESDESVDYDQEPVLPARELRQFFTINDRYRFRRELFGNSDTDMADTLNMIEAMGNMAEAQDYLYSDLEWDAETDEVKEFVEIIQRYFNER